MALLLRHYKVVVVVFVHGRVEDESVGLEHKISHDAEKRAGIRGLRQLVYESLADLW